MPMRVPTSIAKPTCVCVCVCVCFQPFRNAELLVLQVDEVDALFCYCTFTKQKKKMNKNTCNIIPWRCGEFKLLYCWTSARYAMSSTGADLPCTPKPNVILPIFTNLKPVHNQCTQWVRKVFRPPYIFHSLLYCSHLLKSFKFIFFPH